MPYFVRKISMVKWIPEENIADNPFDVSADAITADLRTKSNTLSVWQIENENNIEDAVLAIVSGFDKIDTFDVVWIEKEELDKRGIKFVQSPGDTPISHLVDTHIDLSFLNYYCVGLVAESIIDTIKSKRFKRYYKVDTKKLLKDAISNGILNINDLKEKIRLDLKI
jgi:hypothetical protein